MGSQTQVLRAQKIIRVCSWIKKCFDAGRNVYKEKLIKVIMNDMAATRRTAVEYVDAAQARMNFFNFGGILKEGKGEVQMNIAVEDDGSPIDNDKSTIREGEKEGIQDSASGESEGKDSVSVGG